MPNSSPVTAAAVSARMIDPSGTYAGTGVKLCIRMAIPQPTTMPTTPPTSVNGAASTRNCHMTSRRVAPSALRTPISRVRSVTEIIMIATTPMPPTIKPTVEGAVERDRVLGNHEHVHPSGPELQVLQKCAVRNHHLGTVTIAEQTGRWVVNADHVVWQSADLDPPVHRIPVAEQILRQLAVDDRDVRVRRVFEMCKRAAGVDVATLDLRPIGIAAANPGGREAVALEFDVGRRVLVHHDERDRRQLRQPVGLFYGNRRAAAPRIGVLRVLV